MTEYYCLVPNNRFKMVVYRVVWETIRVDLEDVTTGVCFHKSQANYVQKEIA